MDVKKWIEALIEGIDNLGSMYIRYNAKSLRKVLEKILNYIKHIKQECDKYKQALDEIKKYLDAQQKYFDGEYYHNLLDIINKVKE